MFPDEEFLFIDGYDLAIVGYDSATMRLIYDYNQLVLIHMEVENTDYIDTVAYLEHNILGSYIGEKSPIILERFED